MLLQLLHLALERRRLRFASIKRDIVTGEALLGAISTYGTKTIALKIILLAFCLIAADTAVLVLSHALVSA